MTVSVRMAMLGRAVRTFPLGSVPRTPCPRAGAWGCCRTAGAPGSRSHRWCCRETRRSRGSSLHSWWEKAMRSLIHTGSESIPVCTHLPIQVLPTWTIDYGVWREREPGPWDWRYCILGICYCEVFLPGIWCQSPGRKFRSDFKRTLKN